MLLRRRLAVAYCRHGKLREIVDIPQQPVSRAGRTAALAFGLWAATSTPAWAEVRFVDATGLHFVHDSGMAEKRSIVEITGAGVGLLDFDGDGRLDVWLVQGGPLGHRHEQAPPSDRLFRNVSLDGQMRFEDVTEAAGVTATHYGMGIACADFDNDGDTDVFLANFGANQLFENLGNGRFRDATASAGLIGEHWSIAASFADIDRDGLLDLYVVNYLDLNEGRPCRGYCPPNSYRRVPDQLYRNSGDGRFENISRRAGIDAIARAGMGVVAADFNADGKVDFYVANDADENLLWLNQGDGRFADNALLAGAAVNAYGAAEASMGAIAADYDRDGDEDLFLTHDIRESNTLFVNDGIGQFEDRTSAARLAAGSMANTGFGTGWFDADNDGDLDLFAANGSVNLAAALPLRQFNQLWLNDGQGRYQPVDGGPAFALQETSRGAAFGDLDDDGDIDIVVANNHGPARLYRNDSTAMHWLGLALVDDTGPTLGSTVRLEAQPPRHRRIHTDGGYASAHDARIVFGLGRESAPRWVRVRWANGTEEPFGPLAVDRYHTLRRTTGARYAAAAP